MTAQPPFDPGAYRSDAVPSDTQAIYIPVSYTHLTLPTKA